MRGLSRAGSLSLRAAFSALNIDEFHCGRELLQERREVHARLYAGKILKFVGHKTNFRDKKIEKIGAIEMHDL